MSEEITENIKPPEVAQATGAAPIIQAVPAAQAAPVTPIATAQATPVAAPVARAIPPRPVAPAAIPMQQGKPTKEPLLAAIISFFIPGAGQFYNGHALKGAFFLISIPILMLVIPAVVEVLLLAIFQDPSVLLALVFLEPLMGVISLIIWAINVYDAYKGAEKINRRNGNEASI